MKLNILNTSLPRTVCVSHILCASGNSHIWCAHGTSQTVCANGVSHIWCPHGTSHIDSTSGPSRMFSAAAMFVTSPRPSLPFCALFLFLLLPDFFLCFPIVCFYVFDEIWPSVVIAEVERCFRSLSFHMFAFSLSLAIVGLILSCFSLSSCRSPLSNLVQAILKVLKDFLVDCLICEKTMVDAVECRNTIHSRVPLSSAIVFVSVLIHVFLSRLCSFKKSFPALINALLIILSAEYCARMICLSFVVLLVFMSK